MIKERDEDGRLKFVSFSQRLQNIDVDVIHRVKGRHTNDDASPDTGDKGCHLQDELERCKNLETAAAFQRFYYKLWPLVQSLPELLHHQKQVVSMMLELIGTVPADVLPPFLSLVASLANDLREDMAPYFHHFFKAIVKRVPDCAFDQDGRPTPELTGKAFEGLSYLIKYYLPQLSEPEPKGSAADAIEGSGNDKKEKNKKDQKGGKKEGKKGSSSSAVVAVLPVERGPEQMRVYYGELLGSHTHYVRDMSAKTFSTLFRKLKGPVFKGHYKKIVKALALNCKHILAKGDKNSSSSSSCSREAWTYFPAQSITAADYEMNMQQQNSKKGGKHSHVLGNDNNVDEGAVYLTSSPGGYNNKALLSSGDADRWNRIENLIAGVSALLFQVTRGVRGCMHSKGLARLRDAASVMLPISSSQIEALSAAAANGKKGSSSKGDSAQAKSRKGKKGGYSDTASGSGTAQEALAAVSPDAPAVAYAAGSVVKAIFSRLMRHVHPANMAELWVALLELSQQATRLLKLVQSLGDDVADQSVLAPATHAAKLAWLCVAEMMLFALEHSGGRGLSNPEVREALQPHVVSVVIGMCRASFSFQVKQDGGRRGPHDFVAVVQTGRHLLCALWSMFPSHPSVLSKGSALLRAEMPQVVPTPALLDFSRHMFAVLPAKVVRGYVVQPMLAALADMAQVEKSIGLRSDWLPLLLELLLKIKDIRPLTDKLPSSSTTSGNASAGALIANEEDEEDDDRIRSNYLNSEMGATYSMESEDEYLDGDEEDDDEDDEDAAAGGSGSSSAKKAKEAMKGKVGSDLNRGTRVSGAISLIVGMSGNADDEDDDNAAAADMDVEDNEEQDGEQPLRRLLEKCGAYLQSLATRAELVLTRHLKSSRYTSVDNSGGDDDVDDEATAEGVLAARVLLWLISVHPSSVVSVASSPSSEGKKNKKKAGAATASSSLVELLRTSLKIENQGALPLASALYYSCVSLLLSAEQVASSSGNTACSSSVQAAIRRLGPLVQSSPHSLHLLSTLKHALSLVPLTPHDYGSDEESVYVLSLGTVSAGKDGIPVPPPKLAAYSAEDAAAREALLEAIGTGLATPSYWVRAQLLQLLQHLPLPVLKPRCRRSKKGKDGNEEEEEDDYVDEEEAAAGVVRLADFPRALLALATMAPSLRTEREFSRRVDALVALLRAFVLPKTYLRVLVSFALSLLHVKFAPVWEAALTLLAGISEQGAEEDDIMWPLLKVAMEQSFTAGEKKKEKENRGKEDDCGGDMPALLAQQIALIRSDRLEHRTAVPFDVYSSRAFLVRLPRLGAGHVDASGNIDMTATIVASASGDGTSDTTAAAARESEDYLKKKHARDNDTVRAVLPDSRSDLNAVHASLWLLLTRIPNIVMKRSRFVVPLVLAFLREQYYVNPVLRLDPEVPHLTALGLFSPALSQSVDCNSASKDEEESSASLVLPPLELNVAKARLLLYLQCLAAVPSPKGLYQHTLLLQFFMSLMVKPEPAVARTALQCVGNFKPSFLTNHKESVAALLDDNSVRNALLSLNLDKSRQDGEDVTADSLDVKRAVGAALKSGGGNGNKSSSRSSAIVTSDQRPLFVPFITRVAYGRFATRASKSRSSRETALARRTAVLVFLSALDPTAAVGEDASPALYNSSKEGYISLDNGGSGELRTFVHLVVRNMVPRCKLVAAAEAIAATDQSEYAAASKAGASNSCKDGKKTVAQYHATREHRGDAGLLQSRSWYHTVLALAGDTTPRDMSFTAKSSNNADMSVEEGCVSSERQVGFLNLLEAVVKVMGVKVSSSVPLFIKLVVSMLEQAHEYRQSRLDAQAEARLDAITDNNGDDEEDEEEDEEGEEGAAVVARKKDSEVRLMAQAAKIRTLCLQRLAELLRQYHPLFLVPMHRDPLHAIIMTPLLPLLPQLPTSIPSSSRSPALLVLLDVMASEQVTMPLLATSTPAIEAAISCLGHAGGKCEPAVRQTVLSVLSRLLDYDQGATLAPFASQLVRAFTRRFTKRQPTDGSVAVAIDPSSVQLATSGSGARGGASSLGHEVTLLCRVSELILAARADGKAAGSISADESAQLAALLMAMLRQIVLAPPPAANRDGSNHNAYDSALQRGLETVRQLCTIYKTVIEQVSDVTAHLPVLSRLFGPQSSTIFRGSGAVAAMNNYHDASSGGSVRNPLVRSQLCEVYSCVAAHPSTTVLSLGATATALSSLVSLEAGSVVGGRDYDKCMPVFVALGRAEDDKKNKSQDAGWGELLHGGTSPSGSTAPPSNTMSSHVLVHELLRCLCDPELVIRGAAATALRRLVTLCVQWDSASRDSGTSTHHKAVQREQHRESVYVVLVRTTILPVIRRGVRWAEDDARSGLYQLLSHVSSSFKPFLAQLGTSSDELHCDLTVLSPEDNDPEQDFWLNLTHIQVHRRVRALTRLRAMLEQPLTAGGECPIRQPSLVHVLLPLAQGLVLHEQYAARKDLLPLQQEGVALLRAVALHLPWKHFYGTVRTLLKLADKVGHYDKKSDDNGTAVAKEKMVFGALCSILEGWHFDGEVGIVSASVTEKAAVEKEQLDDDEEEEEDEEEEVDGKEEEEDPGPRLSPVLAALTQNLLPWMLRLLVKDTKDRKGNKSKVVRPKVAVAISKLLLRVPSGLPTSGKRSSSSTQITGGGSREGLLQTLIMHVVSTLRSRDLGARHTAREGLAGVLLSSGLGVLRPVLYELQQQLKEGYMRHVCNYTYRSLLVACLEGQGPGTSKGGALASVVAALGDDEEEDAQLDDEENVLVSSSSSSTGRVVYSPPSVAEAPSLLGALQSSTSTSSSAGGPVTTLLDECVPLVMEAVLDELTGLAQEDREAGGDSGKAGAGGASGDGSGITSKKSIKEAKGNKAPELLELLSRHLLFRPTYHVRKFVPASRHVTAFELRELKRAAIEAEGEGGSSNNDNNGGDGEPNARLRHGSLTTSYRLGVSAGGGSDSGSKADLHCEPYVIESSSGPDLASYSSVHAVVSPLLQQLSPAAQMDSGDGSGDVLDAAVVGRISEALNRVSVGLSRNPSVTPQELLLYLHATLAPYVAALVRLDHKKRQARGELLGKGNKNSSANGGAAGDGGESSSDEEDLWGEQPSYQQEGSSDEDEKALYAEQKERKRKRRSSSRKNDVKGHAANVWLPSLDNASKAGQAAVVKEREEEQKERLQVLDGRSAPVLTGRNRHNAAKNKKFRGSDPELFAIDADNTAAEVAVRFCLQLFHGALRRSRLDPEDETVRSMVMPFLPVLGQLLKLPEAGDAVVSLAARVLCTLLSWGNTHPLPVQPAFSRSIGSRLLKLSFRGGLLLHSDKEVVQACFRGLASLFTLYNERRQRQLEQSRSDGDGKKNSKSSKSESVARVLMADEEEEKKKEKEQHGDMTLPLSIPNIKLLLSLLKASASEITTTHQSATFSLIRSIIEARVVVVELYDLMDTVSDNIVLSDRKGVSAAATGVTLFYLQTAPMGLKRMESHVKKLLSNCSYQYPAGRVAALESVRGMIGALPQQVLDDHSPTIFLPLTLQVVNDKESACRAKAAEALSAVVRRVSTTQLTALSKYAGTWLSTQVPAGRESHSPHTRSLVRTGAQAMAIIVAARPDFVKSAGSSSSGSDNINTSLGTAALVATVTRQAVSLLGADETCNVKWEASEEYDAREEGASISRLRAVRSLSKNKESTMTITKEEEEKEGSGGGGGVENWACLYHMLSLLQALYLHLPGGTDYSFSSVHMVTTTNTTRDEEEGRCAANVALPPGIELVQECCMYPHTWVRSAAARVLCCYLSRRDPLSLSPTTTGSSNNKQQKQQQQQQQREALATSNSLYHLSRRLCVMLDQPSLPTDLAGSLRAALVWTLQAMHKHPQYSTSTSAATIKDEDGEDDEDDKDEEEEWEMVGADDDNDPDAMDDGEDEAGEEEEEEEKEKGEEETQQQPASAVPTAIAQPVGGASWPMTRLRALGLDSRGQRREHVLAIFLSLLQAEAASSSSSSSSNAAAASSSPSSVVVAHQQHVIEVAMRAKLVTMAPDMDALRRSHESAEGVLSRLEAILGSSDYIELYSRVQRHVEGSKHAQRKKRAAEAVKDPAMFARRKVEKQKAKKESKKRKKEKASGGKGLKRMRTSALAYTFEN